MKKINKSVKFLLALSIFLSTGSTLVVNANPITNPGGDPNPITTIPVNSRIGEFDPTNPDSENPIGPDGPEIDHPTWLSISVPTIVMFSSGGANGTGTDHDVLGSPDFIITNHSARGVDVTVNDFTQSIGDATPIQTLSIVPTGANVNTNVNLFTGGSIETGFNTAFMTIAPYSATESGSVSATFNFVGTANSIATTVTPSFDLVLGFAVNGDIAPVN